MHPLLVTPRVQSRHAELVREADRARLARQARSR
jgi:hypothetical protein